MFKLKKSQIRDMIDDTSAMVDYVDLITEISVMKIHNPEKIVEFGAGAGSWACCIQTLIDTKPEFHLIEDFSWSNNPDRKETSHWPTNEEQLIKNVSSIIESVSVSKNFNKNILNIDVLRYDATTEYEEFEEIIDSVKDCGIVIIDDFNFNCDINRIFYALKYNSNKNLYPLVFGTKSSIWVKNQEYRDYLLTELQKITDTLTEYSVKTKFKKIKHILGSWDICCATYIYESLYDD